MNSKNAVIREVLMFLADCNKRTGIWRVWYQRLTNSSGLTCVFWKPGKHKPVYCILKLHRKLNAYEIKVFQTWLYFINTNNNFIYQVGSDLSTFRVAGNGWDQVFMYYFRMGLRDW